MNIALRVMFRTMVSIMLFMHNHGLLYQLGQLTPVVARDQTCPCMPELDVIFLSGDTLGSCPSRDSSPAVNYSFLRVYMWSGGCGVNAYI